ncbi:MAG: hypothetical protein ACR652_03045 [Methylocystis sp.]|uniref:hypothetical protein n=1 Tax=Methylocystis sp. TaxID=1911079 RepID=UPI003DA5C6AB
MSIHNNHPGDLQRALGRLGNSPAPEETGQGAGVNPTTNATVTLDSDKVVEGLAQFLGATLYGADYDRELQDNSGNSSNFGNFASFGTVRLQQAQPYRGASNAASSNAAHEETQFSVKVYAPPPPETWAQSGVTVEEVPETHWAGVSNNGGASPPVSVQPDPTPPAHAGAQSGLVGWVHYGASALMSYFWKSASAPTGNVDDHQIKEDIGKKMTQKDRDDPHVNDIIQYAAIFVKSSLGDFEGKQVTSEQYNRIVQDSLQAARDMFML